MVANLQFDDIQELEAAFRATVIFKFGGSRDSDVFLGSPVFARALTQMLDAIEEYWSSAGDLRRADSWRKIYVISKAERHVDLIAAYAPRHPEWESITRHEQLEWLSILSAPYKIDDPGVALFESILRKLS
jgi:hypothetical protein